MDPWTQNPPNIVSSVEYSWYATVMWTLSKVKQSQPMCGRSNSNLCYLKGFKLAMFKDMLYLASKCTIYTFLKDNSLRYYGLNIWWRGVIGVIHILRSIYLIDILELSLFYFRFPKSTVGLSVSSKLEMIVSWNTQRFRILWSSGFVSLSSLCTGCW